MAKYSTGARTTAGSTTLPVISLYAAAAVTFRIYEIGVSNTTATAVALKLVKMTTAGTQGTGLTETSDDAQAVAASCTGFNTHSVVPTIVDFGHNITLGAAIGSGWAWTFPSPGVSVPAGTGNGVGVIVATGTGQILDAYIKWEE